MEKDVLEAPNLHHTSEEDYKFCDKENEINTDSSDESSNTKHQTNEKKNLKYHLNNFKIVVKSLRHNLFSEVPFDVLPEVPLPVVPPELKAGTAPPLPPHLLIDKLYHFLNTFEYNYLTEQFYNIQRDERPLTDILHTAEDILSEGLPIRCIEGTFLAIALTQHCPHIDRVPVVFTSRCLDICYKHIVVVIHSKKKFGAIGFSRKTNLMYKPLKFDSLFELIQDFRESYKQHEHELLFCDFGLPIQFPPIADDQIGCWSGFLFVDFTILSRTESEIAQKCEKFSKNWSKIFEEWKSKIGCSISNSFFQNSDKKKKALISIIKKKFDLTWNENNSNSKSSSSSSSSLNKNFEKNKKKNENNGGGILIFHPPPSKFSNKKGNI